MKKLAAFLTLVLVSQSLLAHDKLRVLTRNLYLGADIFNVTEAATDPNPLAVPLAVAAVFQTVQQTNFVERAEAIADEIAHKRPDVIGLQEVSTISVQIPGDFLMGNPQAADTVMFDYITILQAALATRDLNYHVAVTSTNADIELPMIAGVDENGAPLFNDVRLTDHDVILVKDGVDYSAPYAGNYYYNASMEIAGNTIDFTRGFTMVDINVRGSEYKFVNTHLEVGGSVELDMLQGAQMQELMAMIANEAKATVVVGDFNSSPVDGSTAYHQALAAGFTDLWTISRHRSGDEGFTCCFSDTVNDVNSELTSRIDHIFLRAAHKTIKKVRVRVLGDDDFDMTVNGLWPSDHAGVSAKIKFSRH